ncbi:hypothetical protein BX281_0524 [Streptomyces sp. Ag82_O1-15]|nr:hypothetical protein BX281_0524 [Streptomyces sp. Ag82_O1-15]
MTIDDQPTPRAPGLTPTSFLAAAAALNTVHEALRTARTALDCEHPEPGQAGSAQALAALLRLREVRDQLAEWEPGLIETAREAGASWADLARPLGVSSRQAAERRYLLQRRLNRLSDRLENQTSDAEKSTPYSFFDLITAAHLIKLSWPLGQHLLPSQALTDVLDTHAAPIAALAVSQRTIGGRQLTSARIAPSDAAQCGALLLAAETLLGDLELVALHARLRPLVSEAFSRNHAYTQQIVRDSNITTTLARATARRVHGGQTRTALRIRPQNYHFHTDEIPPFLPRLWFEKYFASFIKQVPEYSSTVERNLRRGASLRLAELATGVTWGECAPALGVSNGSGRRTLQVLGRLLNPAGLWPSFEEIVNDIAGDLGRLQHPVDYSKRRKSMADWRMPEADWIALRNAIPDLNRRKKAHRNAGTVIVWSEVTQAERSQCPLKISLRGTTEWEALPALVASYYTHLPQSNARYRLRTLLEVYAARLAVACDSETDLRVDVQEVLQMSFDTN